MIDLLPEHRILRTISLKNCSKFKETYKDAEYYLSVDIKKLRSDDIAINQQNYAEKVLERFNMKDARPVSTISTGKSNLSGEVTVGIDSEKFLYRSYTEAYKNFTDKL